MTRSGRSSRPGSFRPSLSFVLLCLFAVVLWVAGGASRGDVLGQTLVRGGAWGALIVVILFGRRPALGETRVVAGLLAAAVLLVLLQLVPLPPAIWQALPGRDLLTQAAAASGQPQPWLPLAISPAATANAAASLIVPVVVVLLLAGLKPAETSWLPGIALGLVVASTLVGLLQFSGANLDNPLVNETLGEVSGTFANRNHFALFLAMGCLVAPVWAFRDGRSPRWRGPTALGLVLIFAMTILATGSRSGIILGVLALGIGLAMVRPAIRRALDRYPRWVFPAIVAGIVAAVAIVVLLSIVAERAVSIQRLLAMDAGQDMRSRGLPTVLAMVRAYFPWGVGFGGFDPAFRIDEPLALLKATYFNHAHNDLVEIVIDAGLPGLLLLLAGTGWWAIASMRAWRAGSSVRLALPKLGSAMLLLVLVASAFDYPARTPLMMAMIVLAAMWLSGSGTSGRDALPNTDHHL